MARRSGGLTAPGRQWPLTAEANCVSLGPGVSSMRKVRSCLFALGVTAAAPTSAFVPSPAIPFSGSAQNPTFEQTSTEELFDFRNESRPIVTVREQLLGLRAESWRSRWGPCNSGRLSTDFLEYYDRQYVLATEARPFQCVDLGPGRPLKIQAQYALDPDLISYLRSNRLAVRLFSMEDLQRTLTRMAEGNLLPPRYVMEAHHRAVFLFPYKLRSEHSMDRIHDPSLSFVRRIDISGNRYEIEESAAAIIHQLPAPDTRLLGDANKLKKYSWPYVRTVSFWMFYQLAAIALLLFIAATALLASAALRVKRVVRLRAARAGVVHDEEAGAPNA